MSQNSWPSLTTLCRKKQTTARHADEKDAQGDPSAIVATAEARQRWLYVHLPSPCRVVGGRGWIPWEGESESGCLEHNLDWGPLNTPEWISIAPQRNAVFFTPHLHLHIFQQPFCFSLISPLSSQPYLIFHPKRKSHKAVILLAATTLFIFLTCCDISFGACLDDLHFILPCFTPLTMGLWPLECYPNK